ncbi:UNVERIFIED_CONTAM: Embryogenesis-associated protein [Sesamum calycinum]|uniref:Embryogenesis-associated protein n=1 Tax=Sesamum calycinum TaxID=2727403 RepID=A0AAW2QYM1_9LAMI
MVGAYASFGCATPLSTSLRHLSHLSSTLTPSKPHQFSALRATATIAAAKMPGSSSKSHPSLEVIGGAVNTFLPAFKTLHLPYVPYPFIGWNCHVETIFAAFFRSLPDVRFRRECLRTRDDGAVALDWVSGDDRNLPSNSPVLILLPGLTGGSEDTYVRHMLLRGRSKGWRVVVFNSRGCGNSPVTTAQFYSASFLGDISEVVEHVGNRYPIANLYAVGWSLGANILSDMWASLSSKFSIMLCSIQLLDACSSRKWTLSVLYCNESFSCPLAGAISLCNPFNLIIADEDFRKGFNIVYDKALANALCKIFRRHALLFEDIGGEFNIPLAANAKSVREFDDGLTRVSFGFKSVDDYYSNSSSSDSIKNVSIPLLCIQAENDPIAPSRGIPREDIQKNPNCMLIVTPKGGHLGWVAGGEAPLGAPWTDPIVMDFLEHLEQARVSSFVTTSTSLEDANVTGTLHQVESAKLGNCHCSESFSLPRVPLLVSSPEGGQNQHHMRGKYFKGRFTSFSALEFGWDIR